MFGTSKELTPRAQLEYALGQPPERTPLEELRGADKRLIHFARSPEPSAEPTISIVEDGDFSPLEQRLVLHSPTGLEFGYAGSGPADTALNILGLIVSPREAWRLHQDCKGAFVGGVPRDGGLVTMREVRDWVIARYEAELADVDRMTDEREMRELLADIDAEVETADALEQADGGDAPSPAESAPAPDVFKGRTKRAAR